MPKSADEGGVTPYKKPKKKTVTKPKATTAPKAKKGTGTITADQFARNQLRKAGIKPGKGDVKAQFRKLNKVAAQKRAKAKLGTAAAVGASSALAAGKRRAKTKKK